MLWNGSSLCVKNGREGRSARIEGGNILNKSCERATATKLMDDEQNEREQDKRQGNRGVEHLLLEAYVPIESVPDGPAYAAGRDAHVVPAGYVTVRDRDRNKQDRAVRRCRTKLDGLRL